MDRQVFQQKLLKMIEDAQLATTKYSKNEDDALKLQQHQYKTVINVLTEIFNECTDKGDNIKLDDNDNLNIIPHDYAITQITHIGTSTNICIKLLNEKLSDDPFKEFAINVLNLITKAVQKKLEENLDKNSDFRSTYNIITGDFNKEYKRWFVALDKAITIKLEELKKMSEEAESSAKNAKNSANSIISMVLTILGIFVAIIIAIVACYLNILLAKHNISAQHYIVSRPFDFMQFLLMGHISLTIIFFLMYLISKMTPFNLACHCSQYITRNKKQDDADEKYEVANCSKCKEQCSVQKRLFQRYPYICIVNGAFILAYTGLAIWQFINIYFRNHLDNWINEHIKMITFNNIIFVFILFIAFILLILFRHSQKKK